MGLDMYLTKKIYIGANYEHNKVAGKIELARDGKPVVVNLKRVTNIEESVGYWRKANQIHNWFVKNVQDGVDNCGDYYVSEEQLQSLLNDCKAVKANKDLAETILPTQGGFFFGGTDYDKYYMQEIDDTIEIIETLLKEKGDKEYLDGDIYYHSSW